MIRPDEPAGWRQSGPSMAREYAGTVIGMSTAPNPPLRKVKVVACVIASGIGIATAIAIEVAAPEIPPWATALLLALSALPLVTLRTRWVSAAYMTAGFLVLGFSFLTLIGMLLLPGSAALLIAGAIRDADETESADT